MNDAKLPSVLGFRMGQTIKDEAEGDATGVSYRAYEHRAFSEGVTVYWTTATGVCKLMGLHTVVSPDEYGDAHKSEVNRFTEIVKTKYGEPTESLDFANEGSIYDEPQDWLMGLRKRERQLANVWVKDLPDGITSITVVASEHHVAVEYDFANLPNAIEVGRRLFADDF